MNTTIYKGHYGWIAETFIDNTYLITTMKRYSGQLVSGIKHGKWEGNIFTHEPYSEVNQRLKAYRHNVNRVTEKAVREAHELAVSHYRQELNI